MIKYFQKKNRVVQNVSMLYPSYGLIHSEFMSSVLENILCLSVGSDHNRIIKKKLLHVYFKY